MLLKSLVTLLAFVSLQTYAQTLKVIKVKGKRAIVETVDGNVSQGQTLKVGGGGSDEIEFPDSSSSGSKGGEHTGPRDHFVGGSASYSASKLTGSTTTITSLAATAVYGWNPGKNQMEYGAIVSMGSVSGGGSSSTSFAAGGKFDYDFAKNIAPADGIISVGAEATYGQAGAGGQTYSQIAAFPMVSYKWFILHTPTCVRADAGFKFAQTSGGSGGSTTDTNPGVQVGLFSYF